MVSFGSGLATITTRPPTPPKERACKLSNDNLTSFALNALHRPLIDTPEESPSSSTEYFKGSSEKSRKRVGFSPWNEYHRSLSNSGRDSDSDSQLRRLPPSKECKSSNKSILKSSGDNAMVTLINDPQVFDHHNLPAMLRSTTLHLSSASRSSRLDAYSTLLACFSAYDDIPNIQELSEKVVEITSYIRRDTTTKIADEGPLDIQLATQALKALTVFVCTPTTAKLLPEDFCLFFLERSISCMEDAGSPKILVSHYMHLLEKQKLGSKQLTTERMNRLLTALEGITNRVKGNRVVGHRLMIYQRLLSQAKAPMISRVGNWIDHLVGGMLSTNKDIRARAINFGIDAGLQLGTTSSVTQACLEIFNRASPEGKKFVDFFSSRLIDMSKSKEDGVHVPQIWSVIILLLRGRRRQLECWEHIKIWLSVIQRCFNSSDAHLKFQANIAWNRLIFAINPDTLTCDSMVKMLRQPIVTSLERSEGDKNSKQAKQIGRSSYCTLLYYAFRPGSTYAQLDKYWDIYVFQVLPTCFTANKTEVNYACAILSALFAGNGKLKSWDENRANMNGPVKPEELPCIDSKWIRRKTPSILHIFNILFDVADWIDGKDQESQLMLAWRSLMIALGNAGSKEVKVSMDSMNAIAHILNTLKHLLERDLTQIVGSEMVEQPNRFEKIKCLLGETVAKIGNIPLMERRIIMTSQNAFEAAETPSSRSIRDVGSLNSPAIHLLSLLLKTARNEQIGPSHTDVMKAVIQIPLQSATSRRAQLAALRNLAHVLSIDSTFDVGASLIFWNLLAGATSLAMKLPQQGDPHNASPQYPGQEYREAVKILELGIQYSSVDILAWIELHDCIANALREEAGNEAILLIMTEPLAGLVCKEVSNRDNDFLAYAVSILKTVHWPQSAHQMEHAQKLLWGIVHTSHKGTSMDPFDYVYSMIDTLLVGAYRRSEKLPIHTITNFLSTVTQLMWSCPTVLQKGVLSRIQQGIAVWVEDADGYLGKSNFRLAGIRAQVSISSNGIARINLIAQAKEMWRTTMMIVQNLPEFSTGTLCDYKMLISSSLKSRHVSIVNDSLEMWNRTFGCAESLEYPEEIHMLLMRLKPVTEISLPTFSETEGDEVRRILYSIEKLEAHPLKVEYAPVGFAESQESDEDGRQTRLPTNIGHSVLAKEPRRSLSYNSSPKSSGVGKSPQPARRAVKTTPKARLRHENSQIQFAAVESSPLVPEFVESQCLTDRQKEVKKRQSSEAAAMFPELRSTPRSVSRAADYHLPKLVLKPTTEQVGGTSTNDEISPIFPPDVLMNDFLGSSPTPCSSKKVRDQRKNDECSSSPPHFRPQISDNHKEDMALRDRNDPEATSWKDDQERRSTVDAESLATNGLLTARCEREVLNDVSNISAGSSEVSASIVPQAQADERILPELDVFVDAPVQPIAEQSNMEPQISAVTHSFQSEHSSHLPNENDQVAAQLKGDMERASSQQTRAPRNTIEQSSTISQKRKNVLDRPSSAKRARRTSGPPAQQNNPAVLKPGVAVADCVLIDVRQIEEKGVKILPIKRERSPSPSFITVSQFEQESAAGRRKSGRLRRASKISQLSQENRSIRRRARAVPLKKEADVDVETTLLPYSIRKASRHTGITERNSLESNSSPQTKESAAMQAVPNDRIRDACQIHKSGRRRQRPSQSASRPPDSSLEINSPAPAINEHMDETAVDEPLVVISDDQQARQGSQHHTDRVSSPNQSGNGPQRWAAAASEVLGDAPSAQRIIQGFKNILESIKQIALGREEERAMIGILFESVREVHEAGRRDTAM